MKNFFLKIKILKFIFSNLRDVDLLEHREIKFKINIEEL
jgi:hypothetical protein